MIVSEILEVQAFGMPWLFYLIVMSTMTAGTMFLMWIGEQISERGVGNGMSLIITVGILSSLPGTIGSVLRQLNLDSQEPRTTDIFLACRLERGFCPDYRRNDSHHPRAAQNPSSIRQARRRQARGPRRQRLYSSEN